MATSVSDAGADIAVATERPADSAGRNVGADIGYIFKLLALHVRRDPVAAVVLWCLILGGASAASFIGLRLFEELAKVTNGLVAKDKAAVVAALFGAGFFIALTGIQSMLGTVFDYFLRIRIRTALTIDLLSRWLGGRSFYRPAQDGALDHPEQRIQEDVYNFCLFALDLLPAIVGVITSFSVYSRQLWGLSTPLPVALPFGIEFVVPKGLYVIALLSAVLITIVTHLIGRILTRLEVVRQRVEAGFRHDLGQAREFAEQIVLSGGQDIERQRADHDYSLIRRNWTPYTFVSALLAGVGGISSLLAMLIPNIFLFPLVLQGKMQVGDLAIAAASFQAVYMAFASGATFYNTFALMRSASQRIHMLDRSLSYELPDGFTRKVGDRPDFEVRDLEVRSVNGQPLFSLTNLHIDAGERWLVRGMSGSGKSTFFRVMAGIWPFGRGNVRRPDERSRVMFLPQSPYLPNGALAELLSYPSAPDSFSADEYRQVLEAVRLERLVGEVNLAQAWSKRLSPGEQQRVVLARALLHQPDFLFLDEATSSLDPKTEAIVFEALSARLPRTAIVTIAHTDRLSRHHNQLLYIEDGHGTVTDLDHDAA